MNARTPRALAAILCSALALPAGCAQPSGGAATAGRAEVPHGYVAGAEEMSEPQSRLVLADGATGRVHVLDLLTGKVAAVAGEGGVRAVTGDGRFAFLRTGSGGLRVVDSGVWTVDHGDHSHYYRAAARDLGVITGPPPYDVTGDAAVTAVRSGDGTVTLLDRARLERGEIAATGTIEAAAVVPYRQHLLVADAGVIQARPHPTEPGTTAGTGGPGAATEPGTTGGTGVTVGGCDDPAGVAVTRRGVVFGCADGALLVSEKDGAFEGVRIRYPGKPAERERAKEFWHRPGSTTLAAKAGEPGVWVLDVTARTWRLLKTGPVVAVTAAGPESPVLTLTRDGVLHAHDPVSGKESARTELLSAPLTGSPVIQVDTARAYVNDPAGQVVHEIDYNDGLRRARTLRPGFAPALMTETGR
ncbi:lipoprotein [Nonomuraea rosea]|uniref:Lipoprotein n=1 Tax=Nonomuraea rosea TaxID=638574 RepID=A0ABP6WDJ8_9ACTN